MDYVTDETLAALGTAANHAVDLLNAVPGFPLVVRYVQRSLEHDPWRLFLEVLLVIVLFNYVVRRRYKPKESRTAVKLTPKVRTRHFFPLHWRAPLTPFNQQEIDEIVDEWQPAPLAPPLSKEAERINRNLVVLDGCDSHSIFSLSSVSLIAVFCCFHQRFGCRGEHQRQQGAQHDQPQLPRPQWRPQHHQSGQ